MGCKHSLDITEDTSRLLIILSYLENIGSIFLLSFHPSGRFISIFVAKAIEEIKKWFHRQYQKWQLNCGGFFLSCSHLWVSWASAFMLVMPCPITEQKTLKVFLLSFPCGSDISEYKNSWSSSGTDWQSCFYEISVKDASIALLIIVWWMVREKPRACLNPNRGECDPCKSP